MNNNNFLALPVGIAVSCPRGGWPCSNGYYEYRDWRDCMYHFFGWWQWLSRNLSFVNVGQIARLLSPQPLALPWFSETAIIDDMAARIGLGSVRVDMECMCAVFEALQATSPSQYHLARHEIVEEYMDYCTSEV